MMKNVKKLPTKQLEKFSTIFTQLGLVLVLFIVYITLEHKTFQKSLAIVDLDPPENIVLIPEQDFVFVKETKVKPKINLPKNQKLILDEPIDEGNNDIIETIINTEPEDIVLVNINDIVEVNIKEKIIEDVPYEFVQNAPIFKGCEGLSKEKNRKCFDKKIKKFVQRNFDSYTANDLGLNSGKYNIQTQFIIDDQGDVVDIKIRAPHPRLKKQTQSLIEKLPKFTPGMQQNRAVKVRYNLPISFLVE